MRILVVASYLPHPLHSGGDVRLYNLLKRLSKKHEVTLVCEKRSHQTDADTDEVKKVVKKLVTFPRIKQWSVSNILKSIFSSTPFLIVGHTLPEMKNSLQSLLKKEEFDLIHIETSYVFQNIPATVIPTVLTEHNIEYKVYEKYVHETSLFLTPLLVDVKKLQRVEEGFWKRANKVLVVSEQEKAVVQKIRSDVEIIPNGVDTTLFKKKSLDHVHEEKKHFLYIGNFKWIQNQHALKWILTDIWPKIERQTDSSVTFRIIGQAFPKEMEQYLSSRVIYEGISQLHAKDIFSEAYALLAPLKVAGGTQYKILESMAVGTPVITTKLGVEGLGLPNYPTVLVGDTERELADLSLKLLEDKGLYKELSRSSREFIEENFSFDSIAEKLDGVYHQVVKEHEKN